jgi:hypothetical protein
MIIVAHLKMDFVELLITVDHMKTITLFSSFSSFLLLALFCLVSFPCSAWQILLEISVKMNL